MEGLSYFIHMQSKLSHKHEIMTMGGFNDFDGKCLKEKYSLVGLELNKVGGQSAIINAPCVV